MSLPVVIRFAALVVLALPVCIWDLRDRRIPDSVTLPGFLVGGVLWCFTRGGSPVEMVAATATAFAISLISRLVTEGGLGWGDIKLATALSLFVGWPGIIIALGIAAFLGLLAVVVERAHSREAPVPFGPFLLCGGAMSLTLQMLQGGAFG